MHLIKKNEYKSIGFIDCKKFAEHLEWETSLRVKELSKKPTLAIVTVGYDPASEVYVRKKIEMGKKMGIHVEQIKMSEETSEHELVMQIEHLNTLKNTDAIIVQLPLPKHIDPAVVKQSINPMKDVDGISYVNAGRLDSMDQYHAPCTPMGILRLLEYNGIKIRGKRVVVIGRSDIVGKPIQKLLLSRNAAVTTIHSKIDTEDAMHICRQADIVIAAVGKPFLVSAGYIKDGAVVIDVGINRVEYLKKGVLASRLVGDVDLESIDKYIPESYITPVPGGVGPITVQMLMNNVVDAFHYNRGMFSV